jgi:DNA-binding transcriptional regulator YiaG
MIKAGRLQPERTSIFMEVKMELSEREVYTIRRRRAHLTHAEVAEAIGCSKAMLSLYESDLRDFSERFENKYRQYIDQNYKQS